MNIGSVCVGLYTLTLVHTLISNFLVMAQLPTLVSISGQDGSNQFQSVNQGVGGQQWDDDGEDSPSPTGMHM